ncbi:proline dehydrogenase [Phyllosticta citriasiana]|uniref:Proline dehydrogenase n=1 Tax=Phyllosticta citriasiana TaxID=595635 RepID=A0ABR1KG44_9PEZI
MPFRTVQACRFCPAPRQSLLHAGPERRSRIRVYTAPVKLHRRVHHGRRLYVKPSKSKSNTVATSPEHDFFLGNQPPTVEPPSPSLPQHVLSYLPFSQIVKTYLVTLALSNPILYRLCFSALHLLAYPPHPVLDPDKNRVLGYLLKKTFYSQFCAGQSKAEVERTATTVRSVGYDGLSLEFALEVLLDDIECSSADKTPGADSDETARQIEMWRTGALQTVEMVREGEFAALKWSGLGHHALHLLKQTQPPTPAMASALDAVCTLASQRRVSLLPGAEEEITNPGIDAWTLALMAKYNRAPFSSPAHPVMYNTYQAYLRSTPAKLAQHLRLAREGGFVVGVKLVRGAYLAKEPRGAIWATKEQTDAAYDGLAAEMLQRRWGRWLKMSASTDSDATVAAKDKEEEEVAEEWPQLALMLATHNITSVRRAQALRNRLLASSSSSSFPNPNSEPIPLAFAQLQGMADEVGCEIIATASSARATNASPPLYFPVDEPSRRPLLDVPRAYKNIVWGTPGECLQFLLRRAQENRDAVGRTEGTRAAMREEIGRRVWEGLKGLRMRR